MMHDRIIILAIVLLMTEEGNYLNQLVECLLDQEKWSSISKRTHENIPLLH